MKLPTGDNKGFTLLEIAIVMVIIGLLMGGGISLMRTLTARRSRIEVVDYLKQVRESLITYADINGTLPLADTDGNGLGDSAALRGTLPYLDLGIRPRDAHKRVLGYQINSLLGVDRATTCNTLRSGLSGNPLIVDSDGSSAAFSVAAVLVSGGPSDADGDGDVFDEITGPLQGDNRDGLPNYIRAAPTSAFDDLVSYVGPNELYGGVCEFLQLGINNYSEDTVYVYNRSTGTPLNPSSISPPGLPPDVANQSYNILSGTIVELRDQDNGNGNIITSDPMTPILLSGDGRDIDVQIIEPSKSKNK